MNTATTTKADVYNDPKAWRKIVVKYQKSCAKKASFQLANTLIPYFALWVAMYFLWPVSALACIPLIIIAGLLSLRTFVIFHDCGHQSFFKSRKANDTWGFICGVLTFTSYRLWHWEHQVHHSTTGDLDRREEGDIWTMTVEEYEDSSRWLKFSYRIVRSPLILFTIAPLFLFLIWQRFTPKKAKMKARISVLLTNLGIVAMGALGVYLFGWQAYLIIQVSICAIMATVGVWGFYVQHQFEDVYWARNDEWNFATAALEGSSYYKLPKIMQWFSANIGFHHIHHMSSRIPNYRLEECHNSEPLFQDVPCLTIRSSMKCAKYRLFDEENKRLVSFKYLKQYRQREKLPKAA